MMVPGVFSPAKKVHGEPSQFEPRTLRCAAASKPNKLLMRTSLTVVHGVPEVSTVKVSKVAPLDAFASLMWKLNVPIPSTTLVAGKFWAYGPAASLVTAPLTHAPAVPPGQVSVPLKFNASEFPSTNENPLKASAWMEAVLSSTSVTQISPKVPDPD